MGETTVQQGILETLTGLKEDVSHLKQDMHAIMELLEDTRLTEEEKELIDQSLVKIKTKDTSDFVSHENLKKKLGL